MREDCCHYESRTYDDGEAARFCTKGLAPEAPWRCPDFCSGYERLLIVSADFEAGTLAHRARSGEEPGALDREALDILAEAESIVSAAAPGVIAELDRPVTKRRWQFWRRNDDGEDFRFSSR